MIERNTDTANTECEGTLQSDTDRISIHRARQTKQKERKKERMMERKTDTVNTECEEPYNQIQTESAFRE